MKSGRPYPPTSTTDGGDPGGCSATIYVIGQARSRMDRGALSLRIEPSKNTPFVKCTLKVNLLSVKVVVLLKVVDLVRFVGGIIRGGFRLLG